MATIRGSKPQNIMQIKAFLGLNENADGDTNLKVGELAKMRNFAITADRHLQLRPGQRTVVRLKELWDALPEKPVGVDTPKASGMWDGLVDGRERTIVAFGGVLWDLTDASTTAPRKVGVCTQDTTTFFGFENKVYMLNGHEYLSWDGGADTAFVAVEGYIPTIMTASTPEGVGTKLENVNRLTGNRKVKFSPDGKATVFHLPEKDVDEIVKVVGTDKPYTLDGKKGEVKFNAAPAAGTNTVIITYRKGKGERAQVEKMHYAEFYNGDSDSRVFLYGDGTNKTIYSGNDLDKSVATATYFPDLFEAAIGEANSPLTSLVRHYDRLLAFKPDSAWSIDTTIVAVPGGGIVTAFPVSAINRIIGNESPGQPQIMENNPLTLSDGGIYAWKATGNSSTDHRNADRISDRVRGTLAEFDPLKVKTWNDPVKREFWFLCNEKALIYNYQTDTWCVYTEVPFIAMTRFNGEIYGLAEDGRFIHFSRRYRNDDARDIDAYAETGSMDFDRDWVLKYSPQIFVAIKPEGGGRVMVTVETNRRSGTVTQEVSADSSNYPAKIVAAGLATFANVDFRHWSFGTNRKPQVRRVRLKVKKATFYKLIFWSKSASATATVLGTDVQVRYAGKVR